ncbi:hypothetical protein GGS26DRAFT_565407 [Hypomontagnella submonticulosa]|nr:hypothetical protein GGS26DRAFT_565407 [Hypomontagnella submonticulosa]
MKFAASSIALISFLSATFVAGAKTNEYGSWQDCHDNKNRLAHNWGSDVMLQGGTKSIFTNENFATYDNHDGIHCTGNSLGDFPKGDCIDLKKRWPDHKVACLKLKVK